MIYGGEISNRDYLEFIRGRGGDAPKI